MDVRMLSLISNESDEIIIVIIILIRTKHL